MFTEKIKTIIKGFITPDHLVKRIIMVVFGCSMMAFSLSWLALTQLGTDSFTNMNLAISSAIGMSFGNWQALLNTVLFVIVILCGDSNNIGFGTLANMFLIGYEVDFFTYLWEKILPVGMFDSLFTRWIVMLVGVVIFVIAAAIYMNCGLGTSPCDAIPFIIHEKWLTKLPFTVIRMVYDFLLILIAFVICHKIYPITIIMALTLGAVIEWIAKRMDHLWSK